MPSDIRLGEQVRAREADPQHSSHAWTQLTVPAIMVTCRRGSHVETEVSVAWGHTCTYQDGRKRFSNHIIKVSGEGRTGPSSSSEMASESNEKSLVWGSLWLGQEFLPRSRGLCDLNLLPSLEEISLRFSHQLDQVGGIRERRREEA